MKHARFPRAGRLRRGYHCKQVERFLAMVEGSLSGQMPPIASSDIRRAAFELVAHGYDVGTVDVCLDSLEEQALTLPGVVGARRSSSDPASDERYLTAELAAPYMRRFPRARRLRRGYHLDDVDEFLDKVTAALSGDGLVTVEQAREVCFRPKRGGYDENAVDERLDHIVEVLLVRRRAAGTRPPVTDTDVRAADPAP